MAQFRGTLKGQRGETSRLGSKATGLKATINGWNVGVLVVAEHANGVDVLKVYETGGSNGGARNLIANVCERRAFELMPSDKETRMPSDPKPTRQPRAPQYHVPEAEGI